jgi:hypothetical protein
MASEPTALRRPRLSLVAAREHYTFMILGGSSNVLFSPVDHNCATHGVAAEKRMISYWTGLGGNMTSWKL